jgi:hypothetical protein
MRPPAPKVSVAGGRSERLSVAEWLTPPDILAALACAKPYKEMIRGGREPAEMGSFSHPRVFDPLDLEIIDRVCEAAWAQLEARYASWSWTRQAPTGIGDQQAYLQRNEALQLSRLSLAAMTV